MTRTHQDFSQWMVARLLLEEINVQSLAKKGRLWEGERVERVTEQMKQRKRGGWPIRLHLDFSIWRNSTVCWPLYTVSSTEKRGRAEWRDGSVRVDESGKHGGRLQRGRDPSGWSCVSVLTIMISNKMKARLILQEWTVVAKSDSWNSHVTHTCFLS